VPETCSLPETSGLRLGSAPSSSDSAQPVAPEHGTGETGDNLPTGTQRAGTAGPAFGLGCGDARSSGVGCPQRDAAVTKGFPPGDPGDGTSPKLAAATQHPWGRSPRLCPPRPRSPAPGGLGEEGPGEGVAGDLEALPASRKR